MNAQTMPAATKSGLVEVRFELASGEVRTVSGPAGASIMDTAISNGVPGIVAECGGALSCATCHVQVGADWLASLDAMDPFEDEMLEGTATPRQPNSRLSCQIRLAPELSGIVISVPETQY